MIQRPEESSNALADRHLVVKPPDHHAAVCKPVGPAAVLFVLNVFALVHVAAHEAVNAAALLPPVLPFPLVDVAVSVGVAPPPVLLAAPPLAQINVAIQ
eukprot:CAMPEP_0202784682 /NCGR_PEP_ID=MMETSP1388-20130828/66871_1 /ASSEMBLY_ACC=CAM_ASM_000864 /TAXON_ID=37098 /ORGANISM="Isochrysis sp, Strain CCMP1244" /LENGTH=98 /DNA_ID=CAMNT_0049454185 /DNA_START=333 /DNA_END=627 /DNA_ORIENTATION=+